MSEQNILNPTVTSPMNPNYALKVTDPELYARGQARSGQPRSRFMLERGTVFQMVWEERLFADYQALRRWFRQYANGFFTFWDADFNRYYSGQFAAEPTFEVVGNNRVTINATFVEVPSTKMFQYPSNWNADSVFYDERDDFNADLVKLTGTWDHSDNNEVLWSEQFDNAAWGKSNATVTPNTVTDPLGGVTADAVAYSVADTTAQIFQVITPAVPVGGRTVSWSLWMKAAAGTPTLSLLIGDGLGGFPGFQAFPLTTAWQQKSLPPTTLAAGCVSPHFYAYNPSVAATFHLWGGQAEFAPAPTTYTQTLGSIAPLIAPTADANFHNGFAYFNLGNNTTALAEWMYFGYGFRVWSYKGPDMGIVQISCDGVVLGTVDLYAAAPTASAVVFTSQNQVLARHRVKLAATNTKNAASVGFKISADCIEVMR